MERKKEVKRKFKVRPFDELSFVTGNFADACAIYRKSVWEKNKGYDEKIPYYGFEDWEFWINAASNGLKLCIRRISERILKIEESGRNFFQDTLKNCRGKIPMGRFGSADRKVQR